MGKSAGLLFNGKYTFLSANTTGQRRYVTPSASYGRTYPTVSAPRATDQERFIVYLNSAGNLLIQMGELDYLSALEELGWVIANPSVRQAYPLKWVEQGHGQVSLHILSTTGQWLPVRYGLDTILPYLVFPIPGQAAAPADRDTYYNFSRQTITPPLAVIQQQKSARGLDLRHVDLTGADLTEVDCTGADFSNAILDDVDFTHAHLNGAVFVGASLNGTKLCGATLDGADFTGTNLSKADWGQGIRARGTKFVDCVAVDCKIGSSDPNLEADFTGADFTGADFSSSNFSYARLQGATLIGGVFGGAIFHQTDFTSAQLGGVANSAAANMAFAYMPNVIFDKANLFGASFAFATVFGASTRMADTATMEQADFSNAYLAGVNLSGATLRGVKFSNACLVNVNLTEADLTPTLSGSITSTLDGACLQGAVFTQAKLNGADLTNATVGFDKGSIRVRYCNPLTGGPFPPPPDFEPLNYSPTESLDLTTMTNDTVCPNGLTVAANQAQHNNLQVMLSTAHPRTEWLPVQCADPETAAATVSVDEDRGSAMNPSIVIETQNLLLRHCSFRHFRDLRRLADDPNALRYWFGLQQLSDQRLKAMIHYYNIRHKRTGVSHWPVYRKTDRAFVGICGLAQNPEAGGIEMSAAVMPEFRGDRLVKEMHRAVIDYGFVRLQLTRILCLIEPENQAASKFVAKIGFKAIGQIRVQGMFEFNLYEITP